MSPLLLCALGGKKYELLGIIRKNYGNCKTV